MSKMISMSLLTGCMLLTLQGCGGGGSTSTDNASTPTQKEVIKTTSTDEVVKQSQKPTPEKKATTKKSSNFFLTKQIDYSLEQNITTNYSYTGNYLTSKKSVSTSGVTNQTTYSYSKDHKIMKSFDKSGRLNSIVVFEALKDPKHSYIYDRRLSFDKDKNYIVSAYDPLTHYDKLHISKVINNNLTGRYFTYDSSDLLSKIEQGNFDGNNPDALADIALNTLSFTPTQETNYIYTDDGVLKGVSFSADSDDLSADVTVTFYDKNKLKDMSISTGDSFHYDKDGLLKSKTRTVHGQKITLNYAYSDDGKTVTVKDANGKLVKEYRFEEVKGE